MGINRLKHTFEVEKLGKLGCRNIPEEVIIQDLKEELALSHEEAKRLFQKEVACFV